MPFSPVMTRKNSDFGHLRHELKEVFVVFFKLIEKGILKESLFDKILGKTDFTQSFLIV